MTVPRDLGMAGPARNGKGRPFELVVNLVLERGRWGEKVGGKGGGLDSQYSWK